MRSFLLLLCSLLCLFPRAQNIEADSLRKALSTTTDPARRVVLMESLSYAYLAASPDTALQYASQGLELARANHDIKGESLCINALGNVYFHVGDNPKALEMYFQYLKMKQAFKKPQNLAVAYFNIASVYSEVGDHRQALDYIYKAKQSDEEARDESSILYDAYSLGSVYLRMQMGDSALHFMQEAFDLSEKLNDRNMTGAILNTFGAIHLMMHHDSLAANYYKLSMPFAQEVNDQEVLNANYFGLAKVFEARHRIDSAIYYSRKALSIAQEAPFLKQVLEISEYMTGLFKNRKQFDSAFFYKELSTSTKDSLFSSDQLKKVYNLKIQDQQRQQDAELAKTRFRNQVKTAVGLFVLGILLLAAIILWRNNKEKQRANILLDQQRQMAEQALSELKSTQALLIQSEKMASLGQLTAGIAHEIQNPLNFINNFSELNAELLTELDQEIARSNLPAIQEIAGLLSENEKKITQHGKRADGIVKGMLQHSRTSSGQQEWTDLNALTDEYFRLSYHGFRAKDKAFVASMRAEFDEAVGKLEIVPEDIGRVLLNLFNNAFYAVSEKSKQHPAGYEPMVLVSTRRVDGSVELEIADNGIGIPQNLLEKIFQPFFTTKPAGQGTGLGLSLTYDIIKAHGGEIRAESEPGQGSRFLVKLPG